jgi:hypothetical protein
MAESASCVIMMPLLQYSRCIRTAGRLNELLIVDLTERYLALASPPRHVYDEA